MIYNKKNLSAEENVELLRSEVQWESIGNEKTLEENVFDNLDDICEGLGLPPILVKERQRQIRFDGSQVIMDIVVRHEDESATIFEIKKGSRRYPSTSPQLQMQAIGQLLLYKNLFKMRTGVTPRLILLDNKIHRRTMWTFAESDLPITLVELQKDRVFVPYKTF